MFISLARTGLAIAPVVLLAVFVAACSNPWQRLPDNDTTSAIREKLHQPRRMNHGNYCGFGTIDGTLRNKPVDRLDAACQAHDICYIEGNDHCFCDGWLKQDVAAIIADPQAPKKTRRKARLVRATFSLPVCKAFPQGFLPPRDKALLNAIDQANE